MRWFFEYMFPVVFGLMLVFVFGMIGVNMYLGYQCYKSNDPTSTACFMVTANQQTINLNQRMQ
jgi:hypothetical protein